MSVQRNAPWRPFGNVLAVSMIFILVALVSAVNCSSGVAPRQVPRQGKAGDTIAATKKETGVPPVTRGTKTGGIPPVTKKGTGVPPVTRGRKTGGIPPVTKKGTGVPPVTRGRKTGGIPPVTKKGTGVPPTKKSVTTKPPTHLCDACVMLHGVGYAPYPGHCGYYIQCRFIGDKPTKVNIRKCPPGLAWNQDKLACDHSHKCDSGDDCPDKKTIVGDRTAYLSHVNGKWVKVQCDSKKVYSEHACGCTKNNDTCEDKSPIRDDKTGFLQLTPSGWVRMPCPPGLGYDTHTCRCTIRLGNVHPKHRCRAALRLKFDHNDARDTSINKFWVNNTGVTFKDGKAYFNGNARLTIPGFSNMDLGSTLIIYIKYSQGDAPSPQTLVANGDCGIRQSVSVCSSDSAVDFYAETNGQRAPARVSVSKRERPVYYVKYKLEKGSLYGFVNGSGKSRGIAGSIERRHRGLVIGAGGDCKNFHGVIDEITVYRCNPSVKH